MNPEWREPNLRERTDGAQFDQCDRAIYGHLVPGGNTQAVDKLDDVAPVAVKKNGLKKRVGNKKWK